MKRKITPAALLLLILPFVCDAQQALIDQAYFFGRDYYVVRSGRAKMVIQADRVGLGPAFTFLLFDAEKTVQTKRKKFAFNYVPDRGFSSSALEIVMKNFPITALGTQLETDRIVEDGIPSVEARWWASGVKVREVLTPISRTGVFKRSITLESADLAGIDTMSIRLSLPLSATLRRDNIVIWNDEDVAMALVLPNDYPAVASKEKNQLTSVPIILSPGEKKTINTYLIVSVPGIAAEALYAQARDLPQLLPNARQAVINQWKNSNSIATSDPIVRKMHDVSRYTLPGYVSDAGRMDAGMFEYGGQWVRDASHTALGMIHIGEFEIARAMLNHMLKNMINDEGTTMIYGNFEKPDFEQLDQMGEFMHVMKSYLDWTGDASLLSENKEKIRAMVQRPLNPVFRDETGMVHNRRECWERVFDDAYELFYQAWVITGLRDAADVAKYIDAQSSAEGWRKAADEIAKAMLYHPTMKLTENGQLIKRRNRTGEVVNRVQFNCRMAPGAPAAVESHHNLMPDASMSIPISLGVVDPASELSRNTLDDLEKLWNRRWSFGGYERYNPSTQIDQPGPWTFATTFIMRAQHEAGLLDRSRRSLEWLSMYGGHSGVWLEEIPILKHQESMAGALPWTTAEVSYFMIHHMLGVKFSGENMTIRPRLFKESGPLKADLRYKNNRFTLEVDGSGSVSYALINGRRVKPDASGKIIVPADFTTGKIQIFTKK